MSISNYSMFVAGVLSALAAVTHILIIIGGASWYRFFGAGEEIAKMAEQGMIYPSIITAFIALVLTVWALYGFSAAGLLRPLPLMKFCLVAISSVYLIRAVIGLGYYFYTNDGNLFMLISSLICMGFALTYILGTVQIWPKY